MNKINCPKCLSANIEEGVLTGCVASNFNEFTQGTSQVYFTACTNCGYILEFRLKNPKIILKKYNV